MSDESSAKLEQPDHKSQKPRGWGVLSGTFWAVVAFFVPQFFAGMLLPSLDALSLSSNVKIFVIQAIVQLFIIGLIAVIIHAYHLRFVDIGLGNKVPLRKLGFAVLAFPVYFATSSLLAVLVSLLYPVNFDQEQAIGFAAPQGIELVLTFVAIVVVAPLVEEIIFRGFLFRAYLRKFGFIWASVLVSLLFALAHAQLNVGIDVFALSLLLCYLRFKTDSLWPSILLHALKNFVAFCLLFIIGAE